MLLRPHQIGLCQPRSEVRVDIAQLSESKCMHVISRRQRLDSAKARMLETSGKNHMAIKPCPTRSDLGERHAHLKGDPGLLGQNSHGANRPNGRDHAPKERPNRGWLTTKVMGEREPAAGVRLIAIGEGLPARLAAPQGCSVRHVISICVRINGLAMSRAPRHLRSSVVQHVPDCAGPELVWDLSLGLSAGLA